MLCKKRLFLEKDSNNTLAAVMMYVMTNYNLSQTLPLHLVININCPNEPKRVLNGFSENLSNELMFPTYLHENKVVKYEDGLNENNEPVSGHQLLAECFGRAMMGRDSTAKIRSQLTTDEYKAVLYLTIDVDYNTPEYAELVKRFNPIVIFAHEGFHPKYKLMSELKQEDVEGAQLIDLSFNMQVYNVGTQSVNSPHNINNLMYIESVPNYVLVLDLYMKSKDNEIGKPIAAALNLMASIRDYGVKFTKNHFATDSREVNFKHVCGNIHNASTANFQKCELQHGYGEKLVFAALLEIEEVVSFIRVKKEPVIE